MFYHATIRSSQAMCYNQVWKIVLLQQPSRKRRDPMVTVALFVRMVAKPGKEVDVENFLRGGLSLVEQEPATTTWFAIRLGPSTYGIFDAFPDEAGRQAHLSGRVAEALMAQAPDLFAQPPVIEQADILAVKLPG
jgi:quinol monooxygenase YgiN